MDEYATFFINETISFENNTNDPRNILMFEKKKWYYNTLYKYDANGSLRFWRVGCDLQKMELFTESGVCDGAIVYSPCDVTLNNSGRNFHQQAVLEAKQRYFRKISR